jgi:hypothetical protein
MRPDMTGRKIERLICAAITAFFSLGAVKCADSTYLSPGNQDDQIVNLTGAGDDVALSQGFSLGHDIEVRIICLGEGIYDDLTDYGWIIDADTREKVWMMEIDKLKHAGGAEKNKISEEDLVLKKGNYVAFYNTDDSHSFERWNDDPPKDEAKWGLSIIVKNSDDRRYVSLFDDKSYRCKNLLAEIVRVQDNDFRSKAFKLDKETKVKVYAIGEGTRSGMFDYGWIEDEAGDVLWKMEYKNSRYAGGAVKNRLSSEILTLPPGEYYAYYETDESHSFGNWNANPPEDAVRYGLTLTIDN